MGDIITDRKSLLTEWTITNLKNRDLLFRKIINIQKNKEGFDISVEYQDRKQQYIVEPILQDFNSIMGKLNPEGHFVIVVLNKKENLDIIIKNWDKLIVFRNLCIFFVNPNSTTDKKWVVMPYTHNKFCDKDSLELGLRTMFEGVEQAA